MVANSEDFRNGQNCSNYSRVDHVIDPATKLKNQSVENLDRKLSWVSFTLLCGLQKRIPIFSLQFQYPDKSRECVCHYR